MEIKEMKNAEVAFYHFLEKNQIDYYFVASDSTFLFDYFDASGEIYSFLIDASHEESFTVTVSSLFATKPNSDEYYRALQLLNKLCFLPGFAKGKLPRHRINRRLFEKSYLYSINRIYTISSCY